MSEKSLLSIIDWAALPLDEDRRLEVVEGLLHVVPRLTSNHQWAVSELVIQLRPQLPAELRVLLAVEVVVFEETPITVRVPDLVVVPTKLARTNPPRYAAADVMLVIEVASLGSKTIDHVIKLHEYADAGIELYWIVDIDQIPPTVTVYRLVGGTYRRCDGSETPIPLIVDVAALTP